MNSQPFDALEPEEGTFWTLPVIRRHYNKVADVLLPAPQDIRLAMLCLPSFEKEWMICVTVKGRMFPEYKLRFREVVEKIWTNPKPASEIPVAAYEIPIEPDLVAKLSHVWKRMLIEAYRLPPNTIRFDGTSYHFMLWDKVELTGQTWSPREDSKCGQLVTLAESLRELVLAEESRQEEARLAVLRYITALEERLT